MLLDTNVISEVWKLRPNSNVKQYFWSQPADRLFLSAVSLAELKYGADSVVNPLKNKALNDWLRFEVRPLFDERVLPVSESILLRWISLAQQGRKANRTFAQPDLLLAATALEHNLILVTRNTRDFTGIPGLQLLNPWEPTA